MVAIVLLPGMDGSGDFFAELTSALKTKSVVVSYPVDRPLGYSELTELVRAALPTDEPFILLAESFSGPIAIALASERLPQLRALVLVCSFARLPELPLHAMLKKVATRVPVWRVPVSLAARVLLGRYRSTAIEARLKRAIRLVSPAVWRARIRAAFAADETSSLFRIQVPLLYLRASEDKVMLPAASAAIARHVPTAKVVEIEGPHFLLQAKPRESAAVVEAFCKEHGLTL